MKIVCDSCGAKYSIADEKVAGKIFKIRCKRCSSVLEVRGDQTGSHPFAGSSASQEPSGDAVWYIVVDGEQKGPLPPIELSQLFAKGTIGLDSYVWKEGFDDWKVAADVPELAQIFGGAASAPQPSRPDDTSALGAGGDLFGEGGREPTSEIDTNSSMFAGFDEAPTPTSGESEGAPVAADPQEAPGGDPVGDVGDVGAVGGGMTATAPQRMTGQRNENSVLFSLSNLQQLASRGGAAAEPAASTPAPALGGQSSPPATGEGSGLIDIRALAKSTTPGTKAAPSQAVDDLLAIGAGGGGGALGAPLLGPAPLETSEGNRWLWIAGAAIAVIAIVGAGVGVGMALGGSDDDTLEIAAAPKQPAEPARAAAAAPVEAQTQKAPAEPTEEAAVVDIEEPAEAATIQEPAPASETKRPTTRKRTASTSAPRTRTTAAAAPAPAPKRKSNNLDALMDEVVGGSSSKPSKTTRSTSSGSSSSNLPDAPSRSDVKTALQGVSGAVKACRKDAGGTATVNVTFTGKTGRATGARVTSGPFKGTAVGTCIQNAVKRARVPRFKQSTFKVTFPYRL